MPVRAVLFDLGETLVGNNLNTFETFHRILESAGFTVSVRQVEEAFHLLKDGEGVVFDQLQGKIPPQDLYSLWDSMVLRALGIEDDGTLAIAIDNQWNAVSSPFAYPDVAPFLAFLKERGIKTGIVSNAYQEEIQDILEIVGLDPREFGVIVGGDTVHRAKPDPYIFQYAVETLGIPPSEAIFVGNQMEKDYTAAEKAGLVPFLVLRSSSGTLPEGIRTVTTLEALYEVVEEHIP
ncbi:MAG: HAD-IA family hydrolase [Theionarchaea archaeon]|nr:HAD-IA family hydrolase [Theionarchaea archaeon]